MKCQKTLLTLGAAMMVTSPAYDGHAAPPSGALWELIFSDEFNDAALEPAKWTSAFPSGRRAPEPGSQELQYYTDAAFTEKDGTLRITAERRVHDGYAYTSGLMTTYGKFSQRYGYFEIRAKVPAGQGLWPAYWLYSAEDGRNDEIDVMEILGRQPESVHMTQHYWDWQARKTRSIHGEFTGDDYSADFHTYGVWWRPGMITWFVDDVPRHHSTHHVPDSPMFLLVNLAVGGEWAGMPDGGASFPAIYEVDYIRIYQLPSLK